MASILDNPVWEALSSKQSHFNRGNEVLKYFPADVAPFISLKHWDQKDLDELNDHAPADRTFSVPIAKKVALPSSFEIIFSTPLYQMYCPVLKPVIVAGISIRSLGNDDISMMLELTAMTKPGPFYERIIDFGNYKPRTTRLNSVLSLICTPVADSSISKNRKIRKKRTCLLRLPSQDLNLRPSD